MGTEISRGKGKLYRVGSEQSIDTINYQLHEDLTVERSYWWGEFTFTNSVTVRENDGHIIELEDGRKGKCYLKKLVNRVARGVPPHFVYHFTGTNLLE